MRCVELVEVVTEWMEGALDDEERLRVEAHLVSCSHCAAYVAQLRLVTVLLRRQPLDRPPAEARAALLDAHRHAR